ncbi:MAG: porphobilinogen synthase [Planctomycetota bacterium]
MTFPATRLRRLRRSPELRRLVRETTLEPDDLVQPLFVRSGRARRIPIASMPGQYQLSPDQISREGRMLSRRGVPAVILFGIPFSKDTCGSGASDPKGVVPQAVRALKDVAPDLVVMTDVCLCEYTRHGHCGVIVRDRKGGFRLDNDESLKRHAASAVAFAGAGADVVAPSGMLDGVVGALRKALDGAGFSDRAILSYAAKYASAFYGPFRDAAESPPRFGDRKGHQMDPANVREALREVELDIAEGADMVMVKPALGYQDVVWRVKERFRVPTACYNVSGEYAMVKAAAEKGWIDEKAAALEMLTGFKRAGADFILTYWAGDAAGWLG